MRSISALLVAAALTLVVPVSIRGSQDWHDEHHSGRLAAEISREVRDAVRESLRASRVVMHDTHRAALQESLRMRREALREAARAHREALRDAWRERREAWRTYRHDHWWAK